jgi:hypothetical protein
MDRNWGASRDMDTPESYGFKGSFNSLPKESQSLLGGVVDENVFSKKTPLVLTFWKLFEFIP